MRDAIAGCARRGVLLVCSIADLVALPLRELVSISFFILRIMLSAPVNHTSVVVFAELREVFGDVIFVDAINERMRAATLAYLFRTIIGR